jgi:FkbM family methyltransferase
MQKGRRLGSLRFLLRHPGSVLSLLKGISTRDLILRNDLRREGILLTAEEARGLGRRHLNVRTVRLLARSFAGAEPRTLIDVGASRGEFAAAALVAFPGIRVLAFEPLHDLCRDLSRHLSRHPGCRALPFALGREEGSLTIHRSQNPGSSSLLPMLDAHREAFPGTDVVAEETVRVRRLDDVLAEEGPGLPRPTLLKIDVQGYEHHVLDGARSTLEHVDELIVEMSLTPLYEGQLLADEIRDRLEAAGFAWMGAFDEVVSPVDGKARQVDGHFVRTGR